MRSRRFARPPGLGVSPSKVRIRGLLRRTAGSRILRKLGTVKKGIIKLEEVDNCTRYARDSEKRSRLKTYVKLHFEVNSLEDPFPLTPGKLMRVVQHMKSMGYRSTESYLCTTRQSR